MNNKVFIYILIIVLLLGAGAYMWLWPFSVAPDMVGSEMEEENNEEMVETENQEKKEIVFKEGDMPGWKKYTSQDWGFEIQIPDGWEVEEGRAEKDHPNVQAGTREENQLNQVNIIGEGYMIAINKNIGIGGPRKDYEVIERTIAGQNVEIGHVDNPDDVNKFSQVLTLEFANGDYYFIRVNSKESDDQDIIYAILDSFKIF